MGSPTLFNHELISHKLKERVWVDSARRKANMAIAVKLNRRKPQSKIETWEWTPMFNIPMSPNPV
ncbi:hypothetical protein N7471_010884 [Penicillium samsonianum]|uniref:uncharacterized protein n=1 Tax=Penicillium samsonianum TaxID=1882272 RepID=UPI002549907C|nr:uncharacterized protein N7471_010884 [Penicillium samsonianum]KAJ6123567.1 hypothetical protein N7471_010884 [Penicillium samsonianum]